MAETIPAPGSPYADTYLTYRQLGWPGTLPVPARQKTPPPDGFTGWDGHYPSGADAHAFTEDIRWTGANIVQRMASTMVGIDIDGYPPKTGAAALTEAQHRWGPLPIGPWSSARDDGVSGIRFFRVPDGTVLHTVIGFPELNIGNIEIIQRHHRYAVVWPSIHPTGVTYTWRAANGDVLDEPPSPDDFPALPATWLAALAGTGTETERACPEQVTAFLDALPVGDPCTTVVDRLAQAAAALRAPIKSRHDDTCENVLRLLRLGEQGHPGVTPALAALREVFIREVITDGSRTRCSAGTEFDRMTEGDRGVGLIHATPTAAGDRGCRCPAPDGRPSLTIESTADMVEWLRDEIGTGRLAGMLARGDDIVFCPRIGDDGYVKLTSVERDDDGPAQIRPMSISRIASYVQLEYRCHKILKDENGNTFTVPAMFPQGAARPAFDHPDKMTHLRRLRGVTHTPIPRADGTILDTPGYDPATRLLYLPAPDLVVEPVPTEPTDTQVADALKLLRWLVEEFQFLTVHDEANFHGALLTPLLREITPPPYKLAAIGAPQPGSGKSLLAAIPRTLHGGVFRSEVPSDEAEMRKSITSILDITTGPVVQLDNVSGVLRSSVLSGLLTSDIWEDRRLGSTSHLRCRNDRLWMITGNNLTVGGDLVRRTVWCTIDPACPNPHLRTGFNIDPRAYTAEHRGELLHALLVLVRHWVCRGRPTEPRGSDSYAAWIEAVAGILTTAGHPGVFDHADSARQSVGSDDDDWREFLEAIHGEFGEASWTVKELLEKFRPGTEINEYGGRTEVPGPISLDALPVELAEKAARSHTGVASIGRSLGHWLSNREGRWAGDLTVRRAGKDAHAKQIYWRVQPYHRPEDGHGE